MKKIAIVLIVFILCSSHDMYLKMETYFLSPDTDATIQLYNGTFNKSENVIDRDRMQDASLVGNGVRTQVENAQWSEKDSITLLHFRTKDVGTWVAGVSTAPNNIELTAEDFNNYLEHDGVLDMLDQRRKNEQLDTDAVEKYAKHVKAIFQVGDEKTNDWQTKLGYPLEFIPLSNPYDLNTGDTLKVKLLRNGEPLADQLVYTDYKGTKNEHTHEQHVNNTASHDHEHTNGDTTEHTHSNNTDQPKKETHSHGNSEEHTHDHDAEEIEAHAHTSGDQLRTDSDGILNINLEADGIYYLRTIHLVNSQEEGLTHESNWATLTFEVTHGHGEDTHVHTHDEEEGIPSYVYWIGSFVLLGGLFFWFNRKK